MLQLFSFKRVSPAENERSVYICSSNAEKEKESDVEAYSPIKVESHLAEDISQYFKNQGRENFSSKWCPYCDILHSMWQAVDHRKGQLWTNERISANVKTLRPKMTPQQVKGISCEPIFKAIDVPFTVQSMLYVRLGADNGSSDNLEEEVQAGCELWGPGYLALEEKKARLEYDLKSLNSWKKSFDAKDAERAKDLERKVVAKVVNAQEWADVKLLRKKAKRLRKLIGEDKSALAKIKKEIEEDMKLPANNKVDGQPVRDALEDIWKDHGVNRGVYFGGNFQGNAVKRLMSEREEIFLELKQYILKLPEDQKLIKEERMFPILGAFERLLGHFDALFSICAVKRFHITEAHITAAEQDVINIMQIWRALGLSVTVKLHIIEDHVVSYLRAYQGFGDLIKEEGERGHQIGEQNKCRAKSLSNVKALSFAYAQWEDMSKLESINSERWKFKRRYSGRDDCMLVKKTPNGEK